MKKISQILNDAVIMAFATCIDNHVTVRNVSCIVVNEHIYFQTDSKSVKAQQLLKNPQAALCCSNVQIEGICRNIGSLYKNVEIAKIYKKLYPAAYEKYRNFDGECVFEVQPEKAEIWAKRNGHTYIENYDFINEEYSERLFL